MTRLRSNWLPPAITSPGKTIQTMIVSRWSSPQNRLGPSPSASAVRTMFQEDFWITRAWPLQLQIGTRHKSSPSLPPKITLMMEPTAVGTIPHLSLRSTMSAATIPATYTTIQPCSPARLCFQERWTTSLLWPWIMIRLESRWPRMTIPLRKTGIQEAFPCAWTASPQIT